MRLRRSRRGAVTVLGSASASRPNARTVRVSILRSRLGNPVGYRWKAHSQYRAAGACRRGCIDKAPNLGRVLHDIRAPAIVLTSFPAIPPNVEYDVSFRVSDAGGSGLRRWQLQHRPLGTSSWTTVASGTAGGVKSHHPRLRRGQRRPVPCRRRGQTGQRDGEPHPARFGSGRRRRPHVHRHVGNRRDARRLPRNAAQLLGVQRRSQLQLQRSVRCLGRAGRRRIGVGVDRRNTPDLRPPVQLHRAAAGCLPAHVPFGWIAHDPDQGGRSARVRGRDHRSIGARLGRAECLQMETE